MQSGVVSSEGCTLAYGINLIHRDLYCGSWPHQEQLPTNHGPSELVRGLVDVQYPSQGCDFSTVTLVPAMKSAATLGVTHTDGGILKL